MGVEKEREKREKVNERKNAKLANASARENKQLKRRDERDVENAPEEENINILLKSNYIYIYEQSVVKRTNYHVKTSV